MHSNHTNCPTDPTPVGTGLHPPPPENNPTDTQPPQVPTGPQVYTVPPTGEVYTGTQQLQVFTGSHTGYDSVGGSDTTSGPTQTGNTTEGATGIHSIGKIDARNAHNLYALAHAAESVAAINTCLPSPQAYNQLYGCTTVTPHT